MQARDFEAKVIIDSRERNSDILRELGGMTSRLSFETLPVGDYIVSDRICIERKTERDLEGSIINSRLFEQLDRLRSSFRRPMLIIESGADGFRLGRSVIIGAVLRAYLDYGVQVLFSGGPEDTAELVYKIAQAEQSGKMHEPRMVGIKKAYSDYEWQLFIISSIPGIGPKLARNLLERFGTVQNLANASAADMMETDKIGKKKAECIHRILSMQAHARPAPGE